VLQSLSLWRDITDDMFQLWCLAEQDLLCEKNPYRLTNTGQGLNRVQQASRVSKVRMTEKTITLPRDDDDDEDTLLCDLGNYVTWATYLDHKLPEP
jgi:hypothetical protein